MLALLLSLFASVPCHGQALPSIESQTDLTSPVGLLAARKEEAKAEAHALQTLAVLEVHVQELQESFKAADVGSESKAAALLIRDADTLFSEDQVRAKAKLDGHIIEVEQIMRNEVLIMNATQGHQEIKQGKLLTATIALDVARIQSLNMQENAILQKRQSRKQTSMSAHVSMLEETAKQASKQWRRAGRQSVLAAESLASLGSGVRSHPPKPASMNAEFEKEYQGINRRSHALDDQAEKVGEQLRGAIGVHFNVVSDGIVHHIGQLEDEYSATKLRVWRLQKRLDQRKIDMAIRISGFSQVGETPEDAASRYSGDVVPSVVPKPFFGGLGSAPAALSFPRQPSIQDDGLQDPHGVVGGGTGAVGVLAIVVSLSGLSLLSMLAFFARLPSRNSASGLLQEPLLV